VSLDKDSTDELDDGLYAVAVLEMDTGNCTALFRAPSAWDVESWVWTLYDSRELSCDIFLSSIFSAGPTLLAGTNFFVVSVVLSLAAPMLIPLKMSVEFDAEAMLPDNAAPALSNTGLVVIRFFGFKGAFKDLDTVPTVDDGKMITEAGAVRFVTDDLAWWATCSCESTFFVSAGWISESSRALYAMNGWIWCAIQLRKKVGKLALSINWAINELAGRDDALTFLSRTWRSWIVFPSSWRRSMMDISLASSVESDQSLIAQLIFFYNKKIRTTTILAGTAPFNAGGAVTRRKSGWQSKAITISIMLLDDK
jgi:hypothetical protein